MHDGFTRGHFTHFADKLLISRGASKNITKQVKYPRVLSVESSNKVYVFMRLMYLDNRISCMYMYSPALRHCNVAAEKSMTVKVHHLRHITLCVQSFGPLWAFSCFPYENSNGHIKGLVHGTRYIASQVCVTLNAT